ncbi:MAG: sugar ABC transporter permease [Geminicoccaceae bacterium]|nr:MAG: sugar ABC transporter permease [Geminicoccaceae bacterium]
MPLDRRILAQVYAWLLVLPAMALLILFTHYPTIATLIDSFYSTPRGRRPQVFVGLDHYQRMFFEDPVFMQVLWNNFLYALVTIPLSIGIALVMALWMNERLLGRPFLRMAYFTPTVLPMVAAANIWLFFYTPGFGLLNQILSLFGIGDVNFLGSRETVLWSVMAVSIWKEAGFFMIFYLAALQSIPPSLKEAAKLEGASDWYYVRRVVLPLLAPTTLFVLVNAVIGAFRVVDHIVAMTGGGPNNASALLLFYIYETGFRFWDTGYAAALTVVLLAILVTVSVLQVTVLDRRIHYR